MSTAFKDNDIVKSSPLDSIIGVQENLTIQKVSKPFNRFTEVFNHLLIASTMMSNVWLLVYSAVSQSIIYHCLLIFSPCSPRYQRRTDLGPISWLCLPPNPRLRSPFAAYRCRQRMPSNVEYTHSQQPNFPANPWNTLDVSAESHASASAYCLLTASRAIKCGLCRAVFHQFDTPRHYSTHALL